MRLTIGILCKTKRMCHVFFMLPEKKLFIMQHEIFIKSVIQKTNVIISLHVAYNLVCHVLFVSWIYRHSVGYVVNDKHYCKIMDVFYQKSEQNSETGKKFKKSFTH